MIKTTLAAFVAIVAVSAAAPAFAEPNVEVIPQTPSSTPYYSESDVLDRLQSRGFKAESIENWGLLIRAYVRQEDGTIAQVFFKRSDLTPVAL